jgi:hypothetical protein
MPVNQCGAASQKQAYNDNAAGLKENFLIMMPH